MEDLGKYMYFYIIRGKGSHQKNKKFIFSDFVRKREGGGRTKPNFYIRIIWDPTLREGGAKLLFPKSKLLKDLNKNLLIRHNFLKPNFILSQSHMFRNIFFEDFLKVFKILCIFQT